MLRLALVVVSLGLVGCASGGAPGAGGPQAAGADTAADRAEGSAIAVPAKQHRTGVARHTDEQIAAAAAAHNATAPDPKDKVICRRERPVGTHFSTRICRTVRDIEAAQDAARGILDDTYEAPTGDGG